MGQDIAFVIDKKNPSELITLPKGINLYYGSIDRNSFDPNNIKLNENTLFSLFSNNPKLASDNFMNCAKYPQVNGYLHKFNIKKDIPNIKILSQYALNMYTLEDLNVKYCSNNDGSILNGIAYPIENNTKKHKEENILHDFIIGLCNPNNFLKYENSSICINPYKQSPFMKIV